MRLQNHWFKEKTVELVGIAASCALLTLFCAGVVIAYVRKEHTLAVLSLVAAMAFGALALGQSDPELVRAVGEAIGNFLR